jgi:hypothetical protein
VLETGYVRFANFVANIITKDGLFDSIITTDIDSTAIADSVIIAFASASIKYILGY